MDTIEQFAEFCIDGRPPGDRLRAAAAKARGKAVSSTIVRVRWRCGDRTVEIEHLYGLTTQLLPDRRTLAVLRAPPQCRFASALEFIDAHGVPRLTLASPLVLEGKRVHGEFAWFESPVREDPPVVRVVFWSAGDDRYYLLDVSPEDGSITAVLPLQ